MDNDTYDNRNLDDQVNIKFIRQEEKIETLKELYAKSILRIEELESQNEAFQEFKYDLSIKLERIDDILVVHKNQTDNQRKNFCALRKVLDDKVMDLLEGKHGKQE